MPAGSTDEQFYTMLQNLLADRFGLTWHFQEKSMKGFHLVVAKSGLKLKESAGEAVPASSGQHRSADAEAQNHSGAMVFGSSATGRAANRTMADLARVLSHKLELPVDDGTGLAGKYYISLRWSGAVSTAPGSHSDGTSFGGGGHAGPLRSTH